MGLPHIVKNEVNKAHGQLHEVGPHVVLECQHERVNKWRSPIAVQEHDRPSLVSQ